MIPVASLPPVCHDAPRRRKERGGRPLRRRRGTQHAPTVGQRSKEPLGPFNPWPGRHRGPRRACPAPLQAGHAPRIDDHIGATQEEPVQGCESIRFRIGDKPQGMQQSTSSSGDPGCSNSRSARSSNASDAAAEASRNAERWARSGSFTGVSSSDQTPTRRTPVVLRETNRTRRVVGPLRRPWRPRRSLR